jgi:antitoxin ParD1/3/4
MAVKGGSAMTVTIPDSFGDFVAAQIASGQYADENALVCALLLKEQARKQRELIDKQLLEALDSSASSEMTSADWDEIRAAVQQRHAARSGGQP